MSADETKPPSQASGEILPKEDSRPETKPETRPETKPETKPEAPAAKFDAKPEPAPRPADRPAPAWVNADPFPPRKAPPPEKPASPEKVVVDPSLGSSTGTPAREVPRPAATVASGAPRPAPAPGSDRDPAEPRPGSSPREPLADDLLPPSHRFLGLPIWGWVVTGVAVLGLLFLMADLRNRNRFTIVCNAHKVELHQGKRFPWPFGLEPVGGPEYAPVALPAEADCRKRTFSSEEEAARAFLDLILAQVRAALANPGASNLKQARAQLAQAMLLTRTYRARRKEAKGMLADLSYRDGRASLARAENELRIALARFQEAQKLEGGRFEDLDDWISHLESLLRTISPSPFSGGGGVLSSPPPGSGMRRPPPSSQPVRPPAYAPSGDGGRIPTAPSDAGPPGAGGGILM